MNNIASNIASVEDVFKRAFVKEYRSYMLEEYKRANNPLRRLKEKIKNLIKILF